MTLIVRYTIENHPFLIGDVLLSGKEEVGRYLNLPTVGDTRSVYPEGSGFVIAGLRQKVSVLAENLVVGWAGGPLNRENRHQGARRTESKAAVYGRCPQTFLQKLRNGS